LSPRGSWVESLVLAVEVVGPVFAEVAVADDRPQGEDGLGAAQAPPGASDVEAACGTGRWSVHVECQLIDAQAPCLGELDAQVPELEVGVQVLGDRRRVEVVEGHEEPDSFTVTADEVLQQEEVNVAMEVSEQG